MIENCPGISWSHDSVGENKHLRIDGGTVHLWHATTLVSSEVLAAYRRLLSDDERERAGKYHFEKDRDQFVVSRGILRSLIGSYQEVSPEDVVFRFSEFGKPELMDESGMSRSPLHFNIAHSGGQVLLGFSRNGEIGVDIEFLRLTEERMVPLIDRICTDHEKVWLNAMAATHREAALTRLWSAKEAYLKAIGTGFQIPPDEVEIAASILNGESRSGKVLHTSEDPDAYASHLVYPIPSAEKAIGCSAAAALAEGSGLVVWKWMSSGSE